MSTPSIIHQPLTPSERRHVLLGTIAILALIVLVGVVAIPFIKKAANLHLYSIPSEAMEPSIHSGDRLAVDYAYYRNHPIVDGDVVVFKHGDGILVVKRVSAVAGETIEGKDGHLVRNGVLLSENYIRPQNADDPHPEEEWTFAAKIIPKGEIFVTGDNRNYSLDSRSPSYGPVFVSDVVGKAAFIYGSSHQGQFGRKF